MGVDVTIIAEDSSTIPDGPSYSWALEQTGKGEPRLSVWIDVWGLSRSFPGGVSLDEAKATASKMASALLTTIESNQ